MPPGIEKLALVRLEIWQFEQRSVHVYNACLVKVAQERIASGLIALRADDVWDLRGRDRQ